MAAYPSIPITRRANSAPALSANAPVPHPADSRERLFALPEHPHYPGAEARTWWSVAGRNTQFAGGAEVDPWQSGAGRTTQLTVGVKKLLAEAHLDIESLKVVARGKG